MLERRLQRLQLLELLLAHEHYLHETLGDGGAAVLARALLRDLEALGQVQAACELHSAHVLFRLAGLEDGRQQGLVHTPLLLPRGVHLGSERAFDLVFDAGRVEAARHGRGRGQRRLQRHAAAAAL